MARHTEYYDILEVSTEASVSAFPSFSRLFREFDPELWSYSKLSSRKLTGNYA